MDLLVFQGSILHVTMLVPGSVGISRVDSPPCRARVSAFASGVVVVVLATGSPVVFATGSESEASGKSSVGSYKSHNT